MINFNAPLLNKILSDLSIISNVSFTLYNDECIPTEFYNEQNGSKFCALVKKSDRPLCHESDYKVLSALKASNEEFCHAPCHFGLIEMALTLHFNEEKLGYIMIGPFRDADRREEDEKKIASYCKVRQIDEKEMLAAYEKIEIFNKTRYEALKNICLMMFQYACNQNLLIFNENTFFAKILPYIQHHINEKLTMEELCHKFFLSEKQLNKIFLCETGMSPKKYILKQRLIKAQALLTSTTFSLAEISALVGFNDYNYFIKVFRAAYGESPIHYRKQNSVPPVSPPDSKQ